MKLVYYNLIVDDFFVFDPKFISGLFSYCVINKKKSQGAWVHLGEL
jgi:hypothetical protein